MVKHKKFMENSDLLFFSVFFFNVLQNKNKLKQCEVGHCSTETDTEWMVVASLEVNSLTWL